MVDIDTLKFDEKGLIPASSSWSRETRALPTSSLG